MGGGGAGGGGGGGGGGYIATTPGQFLYRYYLKMFSDVAYLKFNRFFVHSCTHGSVCNELKHDSDIRLQLAKLVSIVRRGTRDRAIGVSCSGDSQYNTMRGQLFLI